MVLDAIAFQLSLYVLAELPGGGCALGLRVGDLHVVLSDAFAGLVGKGTKLLEHQAVGAHDFDREVVNIEGWVG